MHINAYKHIWSVIWSNNVTYLYMKGVTEITSEMEVRWKHFRAEISEYCAKCNFPQICSQIAQ